MKGQRQTICGVRCVNMSLSGNTLSWKLQNSACQLQVSRSSCWTGDQRLAMAESPIRLTLQSIPPSLPTIFRWGYSPQVCVQRRVLGAVHWIWEKMAASGTNVDIFKGKFVGGQLWCSHSPVIRVDVYNVLAGQRCEAVRVHCETLPCMLLTRCSGSGNNHRSWHQRGSGERQEEWPCIRSQVDWENLDNLLWFRLAFWGFWSQPFTSRCNIFLWCFSSRFQDWWSWRKTTWKFIRTKGGVKRFGPVQSCELMLWLQHATSTEKRTGICRLYLCWRKETPSNRPLKWVMLPFKTFLLLLFWGSHLKAHNLPLLCFLCRWTVERPVLLLCWQKLTSSHSWKSTG